MNATKLMQTFGAIGSAIGSAADDAFERPIQRRHPVLGGVLVAGIGMALLLGCGMILAGTYAVITVLVTVIGNSNLFPSNSDLFRLFEER